jgi:hypothetical protein
MCILGPTYAPTYSRTICFPRANRITISTARGLLSYCIIIVIVMVESSYGLISINSPLLKKNVSCSGDGRKFINLGRWEGLKITFFISVLEGSKKTGAREECDIS